MIGWFGLVWGGGGLGFHERVKGEGKWREVYFERERECVRTDHGDGVSGLVWFGLVWMTG